ncbi:MAG: selenocysteine-specific translation elongation factor, partial [Candidatus Zixiibacteriota bacterium]
MFILGTAGHIDHGKSAIIKRLTGTDPDRLPEEQERGMTIDIGFAFYDISNNQRVGIIDVPGHERFVKNMISGAGGIDAVLLVIAADDGWMPQSQEHLQIIKLLNVRYGLIALSKIDLADPSWVELVTADIEEKVKGSFLEGAPIIPLSSITGEGFDRLKEEINKLAEKVVVRDDIKKPRLYVDRSFILPGMGGVVAGTLRGGTFETGQNVAVFPAKKTGKVRIIQSHGEKIEKAYPGQRTSLSLTGIDKEFLGRGNLVSTSEIIEEYPNEPVLAISAELLTESAVILENRRKLLMILGTTEVEGEIRLFGEKPIIPGDRGIIFFKPFQP